MIFLCYNENIFLWGKGDGMALDTVIKQIISLFIIALIGFYGRKKGIIDDALSKGLSRLLLEISTPLLIISSFGFTKDPSMAGNIIKAFVYGFIIFAVTPILVNILFGKIEARKKKILVFANVFSNCGFMGFPLAQSVMGHEGVVYASIFNMYFNIVLWTYGIMLFNDTKELKEVKKLATNPGIIAALIGIIIMIFSIQIPPILLDTMKTVGGLTTPISMLIIGSLLASTDFSKAVKDATIYYGSIVKLILIPGLIFAATIVFKENSIVLKTFILMQAMPAAATTSLFAENFDSEKEYSALIVSVTTLLSMITLPLVIRFLL